MLEFTIREVKRHYTSVYYKLSKLNYYIDVYSQIDEHKILGQCPSWIIRIRLYSLTESISYCMLHDLPLSRHTYDYIFRQESEAT